MANRENSGGLPRRLFVSSSVALSFPAKGQGLEAVQYRSMMQLIYVGAADCGPCLAWERETLPRLTASNLYSEIVFRQIKSRRIAEAMDDAIWPYELRPVRDAVLRDLARNGRTWATPMFIAIRSNNRFEYGLGENEFRNPVLEYILRYFRE